MPIRLSPLISDHCVLQRNTPVTIWGDGPVGMEFPVELRGPDGSQSKCDAKIGADGEWKVVLPPHKEGGPYEIQVNGPNGPSAKDVVFGEVWICSGQSNMQYALSEDAEADKTIPASDDPMVRMYTVPDAVAETPQLRPAGGDWQLASPKTSGGFSAVGYYFARALRAKLGVPVGMIHSSWGGTRIEAWTSKAVNLQHGVKPAEFLSVEDRAKTDPVLRARLEQWKAAGSPTGIFPDTGRAAETVGWESDANGPGWTKVNQPGEWSSLGAPPIDRVDGGVWFRKVVEVPAQWAGHDLTLSLGPIDDFDTTFFNGEHVGGIGAENPNAWNTPRVYSIPGRLVKAGANLICIRIWDMTGGAGMYGAPAQLTLEGPDKSAVSIAGEWEYRVENVRPEPMGDDPNAASCLYNAMIYPLRNYTVQGALWYQGESNSDKPAKYGSQLQAMIADWRSTFDNRNLSFMLVELAPYQSSGSNLTEYAVIREGQGRVAREGHLVGAAVINDVGNEFDIHPKHKRLVGERLALLAEDLTYKLGIEGVSPRFARAKIENGEIEVTFDHVGAGLEVLGGPTSGRVAPSVALVGFQIAGADGKFVEAMARIVGSDRVVLSVPGVLDPRYVRFGFANFPFVNLWSKDGLPAEPFRTDALK